MAISYTLFEIFLQFRFVPIERTVRDTLQTVHLAPSPEDSISFHA
jgi:hypothetical protein